MFLPLPVLLFPFLFAALYSPTRSDNAISHSITSRGAAVKEQAPHVLLLTAHPDDECLFFAPTVLSLLAEDNAQISSLCLSTGNAVGLGAVRTKELSNSLEILGIKQENRWIEDIPQLQDNQTAAWDPQIIAGVLGRYVTAHNISIILTFDRQGISGHPNHASLADGVLYLLKNGPGKDRRPRAYALITLPLPHKYIGLMAAIFAKFDFAMTNSIIRCLAWVVRVLGVVVPHAESSSPTNMPVFVAGIKEYWTALNAMRAHHTQLVWFRWLNVMFSRYMWVNEWQEITAR